MSDPITLSVGAASAPWFVKWAPIFSAVSVLFVGVVAAGIAWRQWRTAQTRVQLDLYDRRLPFYDAIIAFIGEVIITGVPTYARNIELRRQIHGATFIFGAEIEDFIQELERQGDDMRAAEVKLLSMPLGPERAPIEQIILDRQGWFQAQFQVVDSLFRPYLQLETRRVRLRPRWWGRDPAPPHQNLV